MTVVKSQLGKDRLQGKHCVRGENQAVLPSGQGSFHTLCEKDTSVDGLAQSEV